MAEFGQEVVVKTAPTILDRLLTELELIGDVGNNVEELADALSQLQAYRNDLRTAISMSQQQARAEQVEDWFKRVEEVEAKVAKIQQDYSKRCLCAGSFSPNIFSSYAISRRAVQKHDKVKDLLKEHDAVKNLLGERPPASCIRKHLPSAIVGKSSYLAKVLAYLDDDETRIIGVCGMAGVGKSELMRCVNNEFLPCADKVEVFKFVIWVDNASSSDQSDVKKVQDGIAQRLKLDDLGAWEGDAERRASPIFNFLKDTSFLVLLDNLMSPLSLTDIGIPNPRHRLCEWKQKVILTTRFRGVCGRMGSCRRIDVVPLNWEESWDLFKATVGEGPSIREGFAREIARECGGLPIALTKIGGAMATKQQPDDWSRTAAFLKNSQIHRIPGMERGNTALLQDLKKSYDHGLSTDTFRECFLCCALWPRGTSTNKAELIDCWIGLGLIREPSPDDALQHGFSIISCLQEANLLLPGDNSGQEVKLQHVMRDMALWIACDCGMKENKWLVQAGVGLSAKHKLIELCQRAAEAERVSLMYNSIQELPQPHLSSWSCPSLSVLMLQHNRTFRYIPGDFLRSAPALTYLDFSNTAIRELPKEIGTLVMLQHLNLSFTLLKALPMELGDLGRLKHLLLRHTNHLSTIPVGVFRRLTSLQVIDMYPSRYMEWGDRDMAVGDCNEGISSFEQMGSSTAFIHSLGITINSFGTVQSLGRLDNVCTRRLRLTHFSSPQSVTVCPSDLKELLSLLETLLELSVDGCPTLEQLVFDGEENEGKRNESWCLPKLQNLELHGLSKLAAIIWKSMTVSSFLPSLQHVSIENCNRLENLSWVICLNCLEHLELRNCAAMTSVVEDHREPRDGEEEPPTFPSLRKLILVNLPKLSSISSPRHTFPWLEVLEVGRCVNLRRIHIKPQGRLQEIRGAVDWWRDLEWGTDNEHTSLCPYFVETSAT